MSYIFQFQNLHTVEALQKLSECEKIMCAAAAKEEVEHEQRLEIAVAKGITTPPAQTTIQNTTGGALVAIQDITPRIINLVGTYVQVPVLYQYYQSGYNWIIQHKQHKFDPITLQNLHSRLGDARNCLKKYEMFKEMNNKLEKDGVTLPKSNDPTEDKKEGGTIVVSGSAPAVTTSYVTGNAFGVPMTSSFGVPHISASIRHAPQPTIADCANTIKDPFGNPTCFGGNTQPNAIAVPNPLFMAGLPGFGNKKSKNGPQPTLIPQMTTGMPGLNPGPLGMQQWDPLLPGFNPGFNSGFNPIAMGAAMATPLGTPVMQTMSNPYMSNHIEAIKPGEAMLTPR